MADKESGFDLHFIYKHTTCIIIDT